MHFYCEKLLVARNRHRGCLILDRPSGGDEDVKSMGAENLAGASTPHLPVNWHRDVTEFMVRTNLFDLVENADVVTELERRPKDDDESRKHQIYVQILQPVHCCISKVK